MAFSAVRGGDVALPKLLWDLLFLFRLIPLFGDALGLLQNNLGLWNPEFVMAAAETRTSGPGSTNAYYSPRPRLTALSDAAVRPYLCLSDSLGGTRPVESHSCGPGSLSPTIFTISFAVE